MKISSKKLQHCSGLRHLPVRILHVIGLYQYQIQNVLLFKKITTAGEISSEDIIISYMYAS